MDQHTQTPHPIKKKEHKCIERMENMSNYQKNKPSSWCKVLQYKKLLLFETFKAIHICVFLKECTEA